VSASSLVVFGRVAGLEGRRASEVERGEVQGRAENRVRGRAWQRGHSCKLTNERMVKKLCAVPLQIIKFTACHSINNQVYLLIPNHVGFQNHGTECESDFNTNLVVCSWAAQNFFSKNDLNHDKQSNSN
jgi:hypothetical protein